MSLEIEKELVKVFEKVPVFGFHGVSLLDYPGTVASIVYVGYCNLRCPYCQNPSLLDPAENNLDPMPAQYFYNEIVKRKKIVKGIVVTGGEPLMHGDICSLLSVLKNSLGLKVKIDTNGLFPNTLQEAIHKNLVDYIAMDIKTTPTQYCFLGDCDAEKISSSLKKSLEIVKKSGTDYEIRVTAAPNFVDLSNAEKILEIVGDVKKVYLQQFVPDNSLSSDMKKIQPYTVEELKKIAQVFEKKTEVFVRGI